MKDLAHALNPGRPATRAEIRRLLASIPPPELLPGLGLVTLDALYLNRNGTKETP